VLKWILKKQEIARERLKAGWIDGFERVFRKRTNPEDGVFKDSTFIPEIERMIQDVRVVIAREESSDVETPVRSESRKMESPQAFAAVSEAMQKIKESRLLVRIFMEAADFEILDEDQMLELRKTLVWDRRVKLLVGEAGSLRGASAVRFKGLQKEFFERHQVLEEDGSSSKTSPKTAWIQMTKNPGLRPRPGIHSFLYEDGMPGLLPVALLYSLTHEAETRLIRISKMDAQWRLFGRDFLNSLVVSFRQIAQAA